MGITCYCKRGKCKQLIRFGKILNHRECKSRASALEVKERKRGQTSVAGGLRPGP